MLNKSSFVCGIIVDSIQSQLGSSQFGFSLDTHLPSSNASFYVERISMIWFIDGSPETVRDVDFVKLAGSHYAQQITYS
jgi:hypothetical protein